MAGDTGGAADDVLSAVCGEAWNAAPDLTWAFRTDTDARLTLTLEGDFDTLLHLRRDGCGDAAEVACDDTLVGRSVIEADVAEGVVYRVVVDGWGFESGEFTLRASFRDAEAGPRTRYLRLPAGEHLVGVLGRTADAAGAYAVSYRTYPLACEPGARVCDDQGEVGVCAVDGRRELRSAQCFLGCDPGADHCLTDGHDVCEAAVALEDGLRGDTQRGADRWPGAGACAAAGPDLWYRLDLADCTEVSVEITPGADFDVSAFLMDGCPSEGSAVVACADSEAEGGAERLVANAGPGVLMLAVDGVAEGLGGPFVVDVSTAPALGCPPPPLQCPDGGEEGPAAAGPLAPGEVHGIVCGAGDWYVIRGLVAGNELTLTLRTDDGLQLSLLGPIPEERAAGVVEAGEGEGDRILRHTIGRFEAGDWWVVVRRDPAAPGSASSYVLGLAARAGEPPAVACPDEDRWWPNADEAAAVAVEDARITGVACHGDAPQEWFSATCLRITRCRRPWSSTEAKETWT